jgi:hypothetical protein
MNRLHVPWPALLVRLLAGAAIAGCSGPSAPPAAPSACPGSSALWVASDYTSSAVGAMATAGTVWAITGRVNLGGDPALAMSGNHPFYLARDQDTIFALDPQCGTPLQEWSVHQAGHPGTSDPQDVAVASDGSMWVPLYNVPTLLVLSPDGGVLRTIDLSSYDADGNPDAMGIAIAATPSGEKAFVPLQRLNAQTYVSAQPSWMLRIDVQSGTVEDSIALAGRNPFEMTQDPDAGLLWLAEPGNFDDAGEPLAGIERFETSTSRSALIAREADLGGSVTEVAISGACGAAVVADATVANSTSLVTFDPSSGSVFASAAKSPFATAGPDGGFDLEGTAWLHGELFVGDRRRAADGYPLHAFRVTGTCTLQPTADDDVLLPLPPVEIRAPF